MTDRKLESRMSYFSPQEQTNKRFGSRRQSSESTATARRARRRTSAMWDPRLPLCLTGGIWPATSSDRHPPCWIAGLAYCIASLQRAAGPCREGRFRFSALLAVDGPSFPLLPTPPVAPFVNEAPVGADGPSARLVVPALVRQVRSGSTRWVGERGGKNQCALGSIATGGI